MAQLKNVVLASAILFVCDFAAANPITNYWIEYNGTAVIDRTNYTVRSPGFYMGEVDRTVFAVNRDILLERFDIAPIFQYDAAAPIPLKINHMAQVKIIESYPGDEGSTGTYYKVNATVNSAFESEVYFEPEIKLFRKYVYTIEIQITRTSYDFMYKETIDTKEYYVNTTNHGTVGVKFYQRNKHIVPPNASDMVHRLSHGAVKCLHLKY